MMATIVLVVVRARNFAVLVADYACWTTLVSVIVETQRGVPDSAVAGAVLLSSCQLPARNIPGWRAFGFSPGLWAAPTRISGSGAGAEEASEGGISPW